MCMSDVSITPPDKAPECPVSRLLRGGLLSPRNDIVETADCITLGLAMRRNDDELRTTDWLGKGSDSLILVLLFDRLYVLRNQILHGGATWNSSVNRSQVRDGAAIMGFLVPAFVKVMMDHPDEPWGKNYYPVVD